MGLGSLFTKGALSTGLAAASTAKSVYDQINLSDPTLKERFIAGVPFGAGRQVEKGLGSLLNISKEGGGGGDGTPRPKDPLNPENFPTGGGIPDTPAPPGTGLGTPPPVTVEDLPAPTEFEFGFDPALTTGGPEGQGFGFFNQGGLVSMLPRFQNGGEVSFRQRPLQRLGFDARRVESTPEQWDPDLFPGESEEIHPTRDEDLVPSERLGTVSRDWQEKAADISTALATTGVLGNTASQVLWPVNLAHGLWKQLNMDPNTSGWDRMRDFVPLAKYVLPEKGYRVAGSPFWPTSKKPTPFFDPGFGSPPPPPPGEGSPPPPPSPEPHAADRVSLPGIPSEADFSAGFDFGTAFGFNQGGIVSLLPRRATPVRSPPISYRRY